MEWLKVWSSIAEVFARLTFAVLAIVWLYDGVRRLALGDKTKRTLGMLAFGTVVTLGMGTVSFWIAGRSDDMSHSVFLPEPKGLASDWGSNWSAEEREKASRSYASVAYTGSGKLVKYFDQTSGWTQYCPTEDDIGIRDKGVAAKTQLEEVASTGYEAGFRWYAFALIAAVVGWLKATEDKKTANQHMPRSR